MGPASEPDPEVPEPEPEAPEEGDETLRDWVGCVGGAELLF